jgi:hypothetical protein
VRRGICSTAHSGNRPRGIEGSRVSDAIGARAVEFFDTRFAASAPRTGALAWARANWETVLLVLIASAVYQPWNIPYLPLTDFGIFLVERGTSHSLWSQFVGISGYYIGEGRLLLFEYVHMTLAAAAFGLWAPGWHWTYFVLMSAVLVLARSFLLMSGANRTATFIALTIFATMGPVAEGWIKPTGEPVALIFFLLALRLALNYCDATDWKRRTFLIGACAVGIVFSKELLVVLLPAGWLVSRLRLADKKWEWAAWSERDTFLLKVVVSFVVVALIPVAYVFAHAPKDSYASQYGHAQPWKITVERIESVLIPATPRLRRLVNLIVDPGFTLLLTLPSLLWIRLFVGGVATGPRRRIMWPVIVAAVWVTIGVAAYFPWPTRAGYYMLPFALGTMFAAAHAFTLLLERSRSARWACIGVSAILIVNTSFEARTILNQHQQRAHLNADLIDAIARMGGAPHLIGATPNPTQQRGGWASHLKGFGSFASGMKVGDARDMLCADATKALATTPSVVVVSSAGTCGKLAPYATAISVTVPSWQWPKLWQKIDVEGRMYISTNIPQKIAASGSTP